MNVMTEEEAKGKWCPFARAMIARAITENKVPRFIAMASANRDEGDEASPLYSPCIASSCMAWRWGYETERRHPAGPDDPDPPVDEGWERYTGTYGAPDYWARWVRDRGYCGLAGSPTP